MGRSRTSRRVVAVSTVIVLLSAANAFAYWGDVDPTFKTGKVQTSFAALLRAGSTQGNGDVAQEVISLPNGDLFVAGTVDSNASGSSKQHGLAKYKRDGCPDTSFGTGGIMGTGSYFSFGGQTTVAAAARQSNGKIVVVGGPEATIARYNEDGTYDRSFGDEGMISYATPPLPSDPANGDVVFHQQDLRVADVAIDEYDGGRRIIIVGNVQRQTLQYNSANGMWSAVGDADTDIVVIALTEAGAPDPTWGPGGVPLHVRDRDANIASASSGSGVRVDITPLDLGRGVALDGSRRVVLATRTNHLDGSTPVSTNQDFTVVRMTSGGAVDTTWGGGDGRFSLQVGDHDEPESIVVQSNGRIVMSGTYVAPSSTVQNFLLAGLTSDTGALDTGFSGDGIVFGENYGAGGAAKAVATSLSLMPDDKIVIGGYTLNHTPYTHDEFALGYYQANGTTLTGGKVSLGSNGIYPWDRSFGATALPDGRVVMVGGSGSASGDGQPLLNSKFQLVRLQGETNAPLTAIQLGHPSISEGNSGTKTVNVPVTLTAASTCAVTFAYATDDGSATGGQDYTSASGTHTIPAGETTSNVSFTITGDTVDENNEYFLMNITNPEYAYRQDTYSQITITDDDSGIPNEAPNLGDVTDKEIAEGQELAFQLSATDEDPESLTYSMDSTTLPDDATLTSDGSFSWTPGHDDAGAYEITFSVSDGTLSDTDTITITVTNVKLASTTTVGVAKTKDFIKVAGEVTPDNPSDVMAVKLFKKKDGKWKQLGKTKAPTLKANSTYATKFPRPGKGSYKVTSKYLGDFDHNASSAKKTFSL